MMFFIAFLVCVSSRSDAKNVKIVAAHNPVGYLNSLPQEANSLGDSVPKKTKVYQVDGKGKKSDLEVDDLVAIEYAYEIQGFAVFEVRENELQLYSVSKGAVWIKSSKEAPVQLLHEIDFSNNLSYLTAAWDGVGYDEPDFSSPLKIIKPVATSATTAITTAITTTINIEENGRLRFNAGPSVPIKVLQRTLRGNRYWLQVELFAEICGEKPKKNTHKFVGKRIWIPLFSAAGYSNFWFYSRGC